VSLVSQLVYKFLCLASPKENPQAAKPSRSAKHFLLVGSSLCSWQLSRQKKALHVTKNTITPHLVKLITPPTWPHPAWHHKCINVVQMRQSEPWTPPGQLNGNNRVPVLKTIHAERIGRGNTGSKRPPFTPARPKSTNCHLQLTPPHPGCPGTSITGFLTPSMPNRGVMEVSKRVRRGRPGPRAPPGRPGPPRGRGRRSTSPYNWPRWTGAPGRNRGSTPGGGCACP